MNELINTFYDCFKKLDADGMIACYHDEIIFKDPAFGTLKGDRAKAMWQMLCASQKGKDFTVEVSHVLADEKAGKAHWEAEYTFSKTGRKVHNKIDAEFQFKDGLIIQHVDTFNVHTWAKQAMGFKGWLLGWTPFFQNQLQHQTYVMLDKFMAKHG